MVLGDGDDVAHPRVERELSDRVGVPLVEREPRDEVVELAHFGEVLPVKRDDLGERNRRVQDDVGKARLPEGPVPVRVLVDWRECRHGRDVHVNEHPVTALREPPRDGVGRDRHDRER